MWKWLIWEAKRKKKVFDDDNFPHQKKRGKNTIIRLEVRALGNESYSFILEFDIIVKRRTAVRRRFSSYLQSLSTVIVLFWANILDFGEMYNTSFAIQVKHHRPP